MPTARSTRASGKSGFAYDGGTESPNALASLPDGKILEGATTTDTKDGISGVLFELDRYIAPTSIFTPTITWSNPADIVYGTALDATQLDATASVPGTFAYSPAAGTVLKAGDTQTLSVTFTPTDTTDYTSTTDRGDDQRGAGNADDQLGRSRATSSPGHPSARRSSTRPRPSPAFSPTIPRWGPS